MSTKEGESKTISFQSYLQKRRKEALRQSIMGNRFTRAERLILVLHQYEQMSVEEIATSLGLSESRVSQMYESIVTRLKAYM